MSVKNLKIDFFCPWSEGGNKFSLQKKRTLKGAWEPWAGWWNRMKYQWSTENKQKRGAECWLWWRRAYRKYSARRRGEKLKGWKMKRIGWKMEEWQVIQRNIDSLHIFSDSQLIKRRGSSLQGGAEVKDSKTIPNSAQCLTWSCSHHTEKWETGQQQPLFEPGGSREELTDGRDNQTTLKWCLLSNSDWHLHTNMKSCA